MQFGEVARVSRAMAPPLTLFSRRVSDQFAVVDRPYLGRRPASLRLAAYQRGRAI